MRWIRTALRPGLVAGLVALSACAQPDTPAQTGPARWQLDADASALHVVSVKAGEIGEVHRFTALSGAVTRDGTAELVIGLSGLETGIDIRDERMREQFFEVGDYPEATLAARIDLAALTGLVPGERTTIPLEGTLDLHGVVQPVTTDVTVTNLDGERVLVETVRPILLHIEDFGLGGGLATLRELAGLPSIAPVVPVTASLVFEGE